MALVLGAVAAVSSPAITMAVSGELGARGPFAHTVLGVAVVKDVAAVAMLPIVLMVARRLASAGALDLAVARGELVGLAASVPAGVVLGVVLAGYARLVRRGTAVFLVATAFVTAAVARLSGLEPSLVALAAGLSLTSVSAAAAERLRADLNRGSGPVYVVFFGLMGAGMRAGALADLWLWVVLHAGLRAVALRYGARWAGRDPRVTPVLARDAWLGLISQNGVSLALAALARRAFPEWGVSLEALIVIMIAVHEVAGPICLGRALFRAGEVSEGTDGGEEAVARGTVVAARGV